MQNIVITTRHSLSGELKGEFFKILDFLQDQGKEIFLTKKSQKIVKNSPKFSELPLLENQKNFSHIDLFIFFGGDGTLLRSVNTFAPEIFSIPVFGINAGNVGFFSSVPPQKSLEGLGQIFKKNFSKDTRMVLSGKILDKKGKQKKNFFALNECVIHHSGIARVRKISVKVSEENLTTFRCDGLIVSTPTGSTAYNLSANGPIISAQMEAFILNPLAPTGFSQRPIVLPSQKKLKFTIDAPMLLSLDGQEYFPLEQDDIICIEKNPQSLSFLRLAEESYYSTIREKLGWG